MSPKRKAGSSDKSRYFDGQAAQSAATRTVHIDPAQNEQPSRPSGHSLDSDAKAGDDRHTSRQHGEKTSALDIFRRGARSLQTKRVSQALERIEHYLSPRTHRQWIRDFRMRSRSDEVDPFGLDPVICERWRPFLELLYRSYFRVETSGIEHIPDTGGAIVVANHGGVLPYDGTMLMYAMRYDHPAHRTARPLVEDVSFQLPFVGVTLNRLGCVRASQENAERLLAAGYVVVVFPEGAKGTTKLYRDRHQLQRFGRGGFVKLALRTGVPVIPAAVHGSDEATPVLARLRLGRPEFSHLPITPTFPWLGPLGLFPLPTAWSIRFAEPLNELATQADIRDAVLITQINERVRAKIQTMLDELGAERAAKEQPT